MEIMLTEYDARFREAGKLAVIGTGSSPGLMCVIARETVKHLDKAETIYMIVYEGIRTKRFIPFWWSPEVALNDMDDQPIAYEGGRLVRTRKFDMPIIRNYRYLDRPVRLVEHAHDEPFYIGRNRETLFRGAENIYFKCGGVGVEFAEVLSKVGMLSREYEKVGGVNVRPHDLVLKHVPRPPRFPEEIKAVIDEGVLSDNGAFVCEIHGTKNGRPVKAETHVFSPGLVESYQRFGMSAEQYLTGQCGFLFTRLFVQDRMERTGLISSDMLTEEQNAQILRWAEELSIRTETSITEINW